MKTRRSQTSRSIVMILLALGTFMAAGAHANDAVHIDRQRSEAQKTRPAVRTPRIGKSMAVDDSFALKFAYRGAIKKLEQNESCRALFDGLLLDGLEALKRTQYRAVQSTEERAPCVGGVAAYTAVGASRVMICSHFHTLDRPTKTAVLIHEALHNAGLSEAPVDPDAPTAAEIEEMVEEACALR
jgi:hypothetical protein